MIFMTIEEIISLHSKLIEKTGGLDGIANVGLLESGVLNCHASFMGVEKYPTIEEKSARLAFSLANNHAFLDGNKRIAVLSMLTTLSMNGISIACTNVEVIQLGLGLATGTWGYEQTLQWIHSHKEK